MNEPKPQRSEPGERAAQVASAKSGRPGTPIDPYRLWLIFRRGWQVLALAGVVGAFVGAAVAKKVVKQRFEAHGVLSWDGRLERQSALQRQTILDSLNVRQSYERLAARLQIQEGDAEALRYAVKVTPSGTSNTIAIDAVWTDGAGAAALVNGVIDLFVEQRLVRVDVAIEEREQAFAQFARTRGRFKHSVRPPRPAV